MKAARRSDHTRYQIGAALSDPKTGRVKQIGWNHFFPAHRTLKCYRSTWHAEFHVIMRTGLDRTNGTMLTIFGQVRNNGNTIVSKPCLVCQELCREAGIVKIEYSTKTASGWEVIVRKHGQWHTVSTLPSGNDDTL